MDKETARKIILMLDALLDAGKQKPSILEQEWDVHDYGEGHNNPAYDTHRMIRNGDNLTIATYVPKEFAAQIASLPDFAGRWWRYETR